MYHLILVGPHGLVWSKQCAVTDEATLTSWGLLRSPDDNPRGAGRPCVVYNVRFPPNDAGVRGAPTAAHGLNKMARVIGSSFVTAASLSKKIPKYVGGTDVPFTEWRGFRITRAADEALVQAVIDNETARD